MTPSMLLLIRGRPRRSFPLPGICSRQTARASRVSQLGSSRTPFLMKTVYWNTSTMTSLRSLGGMSHWYRVSLSFASPLWEAKPCCPLMSRPFPRIKAGYRKSGMSSTKRMTGSQQSNCCRFIRLRPVSRSFSQNSRVTSRTSLRSKMPWNRCRCLV